MFDGFGEVRSVLHGVRSEERWERLCVLLDGMSGAHLAGRVLPYVCESIERWPERLRVAPWRWVERLIYAGRCDLITLTKRVSFAGHRLRLETLEVLLESPSVRGLSFVGLGSHVRGPEALEMLLGSSALREGSVRGVGFEEVGMSAEELSMALESGIPWRELEFADMDMSERASELALHDAARTLERLRLERCRLGERAATSIASSPSFGALEELSVAGNAFGPFVSRLVRTAAYVGSFPKLRALDLSSTNLQPGDVEGLFAWLERAPLESLDLSMVPTADAFVRRLPDSPRFSSLRHVAVVGSLSESDPLAWLIDAPGVSEQLRAHALEQLCVMSRPQAAQPESERSQFELPW